MKCRHCVNEATEHHEGSHLCRFHYLDRYNYKLSKQEEAGAIVGVCLLIALLLIIVVAMIGGVH